LALCMTSHDVTSQLSSGNKNEGCPCVLWCGERVSSWRCFGTPKAQFTLKPPEVCNLSQLSSLQPLNAPVPYGSAERTLLSLQHPSPLSLPPPPHDCPVGHYLFFRSDSRVSRNACPTPWTPWDHLFGVFGVLGQRHWGWRGCSPAQCLTHFF